MAELTMIFTFRIRLFNVLLLSVCIAGESAEDIVGCGGFLKTQVPIDFSKVVIRLYTKQGTLKDSSDCAPTNGYYFIPIYDKGEYILKLEAPPGWYFEPERVALTFDGISDPCSKASDINFVFKGFSVHGQVTSRGSREGPDNVAVSLISVESNAIRDRTKTNENGYFEFKPVKPGDYIVEMEDDRYKFLKNSTRIYVKNENLDIPPDSLVVAGYDIVGDVAFGEEPIEGIHFVLYGNDEKSRSVTIPNCSRAPLPQLGNKNFICHVTSDEKGKFRISPVPTGSYRILPHHIKFDIQPGVMDARVGNGHLILMEKFLMKGFSIGGRVMTSLTGRGIENAEIYLNGQVVTTTDGEGKYDLDNMEPGTYVLHVNSDGLKFEKTNVKLSPNKPEIETFYPSEFRVCGKVSPYPGKSLRFIQIREKNKLDVTEVEADRDTGTFCHFLRPGNYVFNVKISDFEKTRGLQYLPATREVVVKNGPINGIEFSQLKCRVTGKMTKLSPLESIKGGEVMVKLKSQNAVVALRTLERIETGYVFSDVLPGNYDVEIQSNKWCFENYVHSVSVVSTETLVPDFVQSGFKVKVFASHETKARLGPSRHPKMSGKNVEITLAKGENTICLPNSTTYEFEPFGCHGYERSHFTYQVGKDEILRLNAIAHEVTGFVATADPVDNLYVSVSQSDALIKSIGPLKGVREEETFKYEFGYKSKANQLLKFTPTSEGIIFQPESVEFQTRDECAKDVIQIYGEKGLILEGGLVPPLQNVKITIQVSENDGKARELVQVTKEDGRYKFGPLKATVKYNITAEKESYVFTGPDKSGMFTAHKLAEIYVTVMDNSTKEPLQGVLLSLTGGEKYRKNSVTEENGALNFHSLSPGEYFLRPMMKEYKFDPSSQIIQIKEGVTERIHLKGRRVSFSVYGTVTSLNGEAEPNIVIEAIGMEACSNLQEESMSESTGEFRIRGLLPHCEYNVRLKHDSPMNAHIHRINPKDLTVRTNEGDVRGIKLTAFQLVEQMDLSVHVESTIPEHLKTLRLRLCREDAPETPVHEIKLETLAGGIKYWGNAAMQERFLKAGLLVHLPFVLRDKTPYFIQLDSTLNKHTYKYKEPIVHFIADKTYRNFKFTFEPVPRALEHEFSNSNYYIIPVFAFGFIVYAYSNAIYNVAQNLFGKFNQNSFNFNYQERIPFADAGNDEVTIEPVPIHKKKCKLRKT